MNDGYANYYQSSGLYHVSLPFLMGTRFDALLLGDDKSQLDYLWSVIECDLRGLEKTLNRFDRDSEVSKVNSKASLEPVVLSDVLWNILQDCRHYYELTDGFFDVTLSDFKKITFFEESQSIQFEKDDLSLDFGGYAKGYALKQIREQLANVGVLRAMVCFGSSSILAVGSHPYGDSWPVGIEDPFSGKVLNKVYLRDDSMSVSGNTPNNLQHIVNPRTSDFSSGHRIVAVVSDNPVDAEILTTAWMASGEMSEPQWMKCFNLKNTYIFK